MTEVPHCRLDATGLHDQRARYARLAASVERVERADGELSVTFGRTLDRAALDEALAVERDCCPFFRLEFDERERRLRVGVDGAEHQPALDALAHAFAAPARA